MMYKYEKLERKHVTNFFGNCINDFDFEVCSGIIPDHKENYFRVYVDGSENEYLELYFNKSGELVTFGYLRKGFGRNIEVVECGNYRVLHVIPTEVKKFMKHMVGVLDEKVEELGEELTANEVRFLNFIEKNI